MGRRSHHSDANPQPPAMADLSGKGSLKNQPSALSERSHRQDGKLTLGDPLSGPSAPGASECDSLRPTSPAHSTLFFFRAAILSIAWLEHAPANVRRADLGRTLALDGLHQPKHAAALLGAIRNIRNVASITGSARPIWRSALHLVPISSMALWNPHLAGKIALTTNVDLWGTGEPPRCTSAWYRSVAVRDRGLLMTQANGRRRPAGSAEQGADTP
jgi:hypothetical protein